MAWLAGAVLISIKVLPARSELPRNQAETRVVQRRRAWNAHHMTTARGHVEALALARLQCVEADMLVAGGSHDAQGVTALETVLHVDSQPLTIRINDFAHQLLAAEHRGALFVLLVFLRRMATEEALGKTTTRHGFELVHQLHIESLAGEGIINGATVDLRSARHIVGALGAALDLQRMHAHADQLADMLHGTQVARVHD